MTHPPGADVVEVLLPGCVGQLPGHPPAGRGLGLMVPDHVDVLVVVGVRGPIVVTPASLRCFAGRVGDGWVARWPTPGPVAADARQAPAGVLVELRALVQDVQAVGVLAEPDH
eukprot:4936177-Heterocapsa_arctica.AAC.1